MAISIKTCPYCKYTLAETYKIGIGKPFVECSNCKERVIDKDTTEWELKNIFQKICFLLVSLYTTVFYGIFPVLIYGLLVDKPSNSMVLGIWFLSSCVLAVFTSRGLVEEINASNERMKDTDYRQVLRSMGLLK
jgi:hypothetical protein